MMKLLFGLCIFSTMLTAAVTPSPSPTAPKEIVEFIFLRASDPQIALKKELQNEINMLVDFDEMARASLGSWQKKISADDLKWYQATLKEIITKSVYPEAAQFLKNVKISYGKESSSTKVAKVVSLVKEKGEETQVDYLFSRMNDRWKVVDISLDEESWVEGIGSQVDEVMNRDGWTGLQKKLKDRLAKNQSSKK